jgi:hypothetical protein
MNDPGYSFSFDATFEGAITKLEAAVDPLPTDATPAQHALWRLKQLGIDYDEEGFRTAIMDDNADVVKLFLDAGMNVETGGALKEAVERGAMHSAKALIDGGANVNVRDEYGESLVMHSATRPEMIKLLADGGADVNAANQWKMTPLIAASEQGNLESVKVLVAAGPWSVDLIPGWRARPPITRSWGVVATLALADPPRRILEELSIDASGSEEPFAFSLMTADTSTSLGSTFLLEEPDMTKAVDQLRSRGRQFVPAIQDAAVLGVRLCARPVPFDGRPLIGPLPGLPNVFVCAGHGPWGISTGPGAARLVADVMLGGPPSRIPAGLSVARLAAA